MASSPKKKSEPEKEKKEEQPIIVEMALMRGVKEGDPVYGPVIGSEYLTADHQPLPRTRKQCAIVGFAQTSMKDVRYLFDNPDVEIWGLNQLYIAWRPEQELLLKNCTRWFQIHHKHSYEAAVGRDHSHHAWMGERLTEFGILCYMQKKEPDIPMSVPFPKDLVIGEFGSYFNNSISWMIAMAILEGFEHIHIFGVDMAQTGFGATNEYSHQRPSVEYFIGFARGRGIKVYVPEKCDLLKAAYLYPFDEDSVMRVKMDTRRQELQQRIHQSTVTEQQAHDERMQLIGAASNMDYIDEAWLSCVKETKPQDPIAIPDPNLNKQ